MTANNNWPGKPGVPLNPERDGWHWVKIIHGISQPRPRLWWSKIDRWELSDGALISPSEFAERWRYLGPALTPDEAARLQARVAKLEGALKDAAASVKEWGAYASQYLQDKWDLPGEVARYIAIAEGKNDAAMTGGKDG